MSNMYGEYDSDENEDCPLCQLLALISLIIVGIFMAVIVCIPVILIHMIRGY